MGRSIKTPIFIIIRIIFNFLINVASKTESKEIQNNLKVHKQLSSRVRGCKFPENITNIALVLVTRYFEQTISTQIETQIEAFKLISSKFNLPLAVARFLVV